MSIILEGPDGSGKTSLVARLINDIPELLLRSRFVEPETGERNPNTLFSRVWKDRAVYSPVAVYDRHPMFSEYIYSNVIRRDIAPGFYTLAAYLLRQRIQRHAFVIFCLPEYGDVVANSAMASQMVGVHDNLRWLYEAYQAQAIHWSGPSYVYDYRTEDAYENLLKRLTDHIEEQRNHA